MYALKRIVAYLIDMALIMIPIQTYSFEMYEFIGRHIRIPQFVMGYTWMIETGLPILILGLCVGLFGRTPGKLLMFLKVKDRSGRVPGIPQGLLREIIKLVGTMFLFGGLYAIYGLVTSGKTFYDDWLGLDVDDLKPTGLTDRQKKWREYAKSQQRSD
jgi:uncharacterized RDD family membrane protein YckC